ncbi:Protein of unknown function [Amycolatopsis xylanica]|uniref:DUF998 domain-containing protein n=2 Tax=Amycolatopsis xylanica TaxID=589385 RepID=A0A1H3B7E4_9PSEU|nr:Protein of unknown function [Amycolatopsis xylanica]
MHGRLALAGMAVAVAIAADLHLRLSSRISPVWHTLSEYVYGGSSAAPLFSAMCLALALGSVALLAGIAKARRQRSVLVLLGVWSLGLLIVAAFPVDPEGAARSLSGQVHNYAALAAFIALPSAALTLTRAGNVNCPWEPRRTTIRRLATASIVSIALVFGGFLFKLLTGPQLTLGLFERLLFTIDLALLATMVRPLLSAAPR